MLAVIRDPSSDEDERNMAVTTILEAVFPSFAADVLRADEEERASPEALAVEAALNREEESFATNLKRVMQEQGVTQEELARAAGISQPAISQMLNRQSRPQMRTVRKLAEALQVAPDVLWPGFRGQA
jgi:DNA-binding XRE family transcriptional regulator